MSTGEETENSPQLETDNSPQLENAAQPATQEFSQLTNGEKKNIDSLEAVPAEESSEHRQASAEQSKNRRLQTAAIRITGAIILIAAIGSCLVIFKKEMVYWFLVNSTKKLGENNGYNPLIPGFTHLARLLGETYLPDKKYLLRALSTGRDASADAGSKENFSKQYDAWFVLSPNRKFDKHYVEAKTLSKDPSKLRRAIDQAVAASQAATDPNKTPTGARAFALAYCADLYRLYGFTDEPIFLARKALTTATSLWFDDDIASVPVHLSAAKIYLTTDHYDQALQELAKINQAYKSVLVDPLKNERLDEELFEVLQTNAEAYALTHQTATAESYATKAIELAENKLQSPEMTARAYAAKAAVLLEEKKWTEAKDLLMKAIKLKDDSKTWNADDVRLFLYLAVAQSETDDKEGARQSLERADRYCNSRRIRKKIAEYRKRCVGK